MDQVSDYGSEPLTWISIRCYFYVCWTNKSIMEYRKKFKVELSTISGATHA